MFTNKKNLHPVSNSWPPSHLHGTEDFQIVFVGHFVDLQSLAPCLPVNLDLPGIFFDVSPVACRLGLLAVETQIFLKAKRLHTRTNKKGGRIFVLNIQNLTKII